MLDLNPRDSKEAIIKRTFALFLKENNAFAPYMFNAENFKQTKAYYYNRFYICDGRRLLTEAFPWCDTKEGFDFWHDLNEKWVRNKNYFCFSNLKY